MSGEERKEVSFGIILLHALTRVNALTSIVHQNQQTNLPSKFQLSSRSTLGINFWQSALLVELAARSYKGEVLLLLLFGTHLLRKETKVSLSASSSDIRNETKREIINH